MKNTIQLVGNRYSLDKKQREILKRGIHSYKISQLRLKKISPSKLIKGKNVFIDFYNLAITLTASIYNYPVFYSNDGVVRDIMSYLGHTKKIKNYNVIFKHIDTYLSEFKPLKATFILDKGVSKSGETAEKIRNFLNASSLETQVIGDADFFLSKQNYVITSDSAVMDNVKTIFDSAGFIIEKIIKNKIMELI